MVPLWFLSTEVLVQGDHTNARGALDNLSGGVDPANPRFLLARPVHRHDPQEGVNHFGGGNKGDGPTWGKPHAAVATGLWPTPSCEEHPHARIPSCQYE